MAPEKSRGQSDRLKDQRRLQAARRKVEELAAVVRDDAFDDWVRRQITAAEKPSEWTAARVLYENYVRTASHYGPSRGARRNSKLELATETRWGLMMGSLFTKKRRAKGWFYPLRPKTQRTGSTAEE